MEKGNNGILWKRTEELFGRPRNEWTTVDEMIYDTDDYFNVQVEEAKKQREKAIKQAFKHHYENNLFYNKYCKDRGVTPDDIKTEDDFTKIPMIPDSFFKDYPSEKPEEIYKWLYSSSSVDLGEYDYNGNSLQKFLGWAEERLKGIVNHSSGTSGKFSIMFRDRTTFQRLFYMAVKTLLFSTIEPNDDAYFVYPGPSQTYLTLGHWVLAGTKIFDDSNKYFLTDRPLTMDLVRLMTSGRARGMKEKMLLILLQRAMKKGQRDLINFMEKLDKEGRQMVMVTFPFQLFDLIKMLEERGKTLNLGESNSLLITGGGWKVYENKKISEEEFAKMVEDSLGIPPSNYRDVYGMSEMNGLALDCDARYKHLTSWIYPMVLDGENEPVGYGEWGRFAFLDPAANSYPGFIMTGDRVMLHESCPKCDKTGIVMESEITRMAGAEARGCGNLMRDLLAKELGK